MNVYFFLLGTSIVPYLFSVQLSDDQVLLVVGVFLGGPIVIVLSILSFLSNLWLKGERRPWKKIYARFVLYTIPVLAVALPLWIAVEIQQGSIRSAWSNVWILSIPLFLSGTTAFFLTWRLLKEHQKEKM